MSTATRTETRSPALHAADSHDLIRVQGARARTTVSSPIVTPGQTIAPPIAASPSQTSSPSTMLGPNVFSVEARPGDGTALQTSVPNRPAEHDAAGTAAAG